VKNLKEATELYLEEQDIIEKEALTEKEEQKLAELEVHIVQGIEQFRAGLGKTFDDKDKFLNYLREPIDYVEISRRLYEGQTVEEIFDRAKKEWTK
jgi:hypothetical protein